MLPDEWKRCNVTPVPKAAKVLEKIVAAQLSAHLEKRKHLNLHQCAYRRKINQTIGYGGC